MARDIEEKVRALPFGQGYHPEFLGEYATRQQSQRRLYALGALSLIGILLLLHVDFESPRLTFLVFLTLPFALIGGVLAAFLAGGVLSLGATVGFITVLGIAPETASCWSAITVTWKPSKASPSAASWSSAGPRSAWLRS